jgi:Fe-S-cluster containining protein
VCSLSAGVSFEERCGKFNPACSLLDDQGVCSVYDSRPISCRTVVSSNADECRSTIVDGNDAGFPTPNVWVTLQDSYITALEGALIHAGLAYQAHELNESLRIALTKADAEERWLSGSDEFAAAATSPATPIFQNPLWRQIYQQAFGTLPA